MFWSKCWVNLLDSKPHMCRRQLEQTEKTKKIAMKFMASLHSLLADFTKHSRTPTLPYRKFNSFKPFHSIKLSLELNYQIKLVCLFEIVSRVDVLRSMVKRNWTVYSEHSRFNSSLHYLEHGHLPEVLKG